MLETEEKKKVLVCETYKKINKSYPKLYLLPLRDDERYGTLFLGSCSEYEMPTEDFSDTVWRFCENGGVERARITNESMSHLNFRKTPYKFASKIEEKTMEELFGHYTYKYNKTLEKYQSNNRPRRLQRFVSKHPEMERLKRIAFDPKKVASILLAAGISISSLGFAGHAKDNANIVPENLTTDAAVQEMVQTPLNFDDDISGDILQASEDAVNEWNTQQTESNNSETRVNQVIQYVAKDDFEKYGENLMQTIEQIKNSPQRSTMEYKFFEKYSSTINPNIETKGNGKITSIEELISCYKENPERFSIYGRMFLADMSVDYAKIKLAKEYGISSPDEIMLTYEEKIGAYEGRVSLRDRSKSNGRGRDLETPGFCIKKINGNIQQVELLTGTRHSAIGLDPWNMCIGLKEMEAFSDYGVANKEYTAKSYAKKLSEKGEEFFEVINNELAQNAMLSLTFEPDDMER